MPVNLSEPEERPPRDQSELAAAHGQLASLLYAVVHDFRAPVRGLAAWSQALLEEMGKSPPGQEGLYLQRIRSCTDRLSAMMERLVEWHRLAVLEPRPQRVDLSALAARLLATHREREPGRQVEVWVESGLLVDGDPELLEAAMASLIDNAWKFTAKHQAARIEFGVLTRERQRVFFVRDDGAGFDMRYAGKLFVLFQRLHREADFPGLGAGLALAQYAVQRQGGRIWAEAEVGRGAVFYFTCPTASSRDRASAAGEN